MYLLFEEMFPTLGNDEVPIYDEKLNLSVVKDLNGNYVPFVEASGPDGTETETKTAKETVDYTFNNVLNAQKTATATSTKKEDTDVDVDKFLISLNTYLFSKPSDETGTVTEVKKESTDYN